MLVIDDTGDRKAGAHTAHVGRQYLGSVGKLDNGIVAVTSLWADARVYSPLHVAPYTPARRLPRGEADPAFRTKPQLAVQPVAAAGAAGVPFRAVVADSFYGDSLAFEEGLWAAGLPFVLARKPKKGHWAPVDDAHTPVEAARAVPWHGPRRPGGWTRIGRRFRDGRGATWWAADARLAGYGPDRRTRLVVATTDPATLPARSTGYLVTNLPRPGAPRAATAPFAAAFCSAIIAFAAMGMSASRTFSRRRARCAASAASAFRAASAASTVAFTGDPADGVVVVALTLATTPAASAFVFTGAGAFAVAGFAAGAGPRRTRGDSSTRRGNFHRSSQYARMLANWTLPPELLAKDRQQRFPGGLRDGMQVGAALWWSALQLAPRRVGVERPGDVVLVLGQRLRHHLPPGVLGGAGAVIGGVLSGGWPHHPSPRDPRQ